MSILRAPNRPFQPNPVPVALFILTALVSVLISSFDEELPPALKTFSDFPNAGYSIGSASKEMQQFKPPSYNPGPDLIPALISDLSPHQLTNFNQEFHVKSSTDQITEKVSNALLVPFLTLYHEHLSWKLFNQKTLDDLYYDLGWKLSGYIHQLPEEARWMRFWECEFNVLKIPFKEKHKQLLSRLHNDIHSPHKFRNSFADRLTVDMSAEEKQKLWDEMTRPILDGYQTMAYHIESMEALQKEQNGQTTSLDHSALSESKMVYKFLEKLKTEFWKMIEREEWFYSEQQNLEKYHDKITLYEVDRKRDDQDDAKKYQEKIKLYEVDRKRDDQDDAEKYQEKIKLYEVDHKRDHWDNAKRLAQSAVQGVLQDALDSKSSQSGIEKTDQAYISGILTSFQSKLNQERETGWKKELEEFQSIHESIRLAIQDLENREYFPLMMIIERINSEVLVDKNQPVDENMETD